METIQSRSKQYSSRELCDYLRCPRFYELKHVVGIRQPISSSMAAVLCSQYTLRTAIIEKLDYHSYLSLFDKFWDAIKIHIREWDKAEHTALATAKRWAVTWYGAIHHMLPPETWSHGYEQHRVIDGNLLTSEADIHGKRYDILFSQWLSEETRYEWYHDLRYVVHRLVTLRPTYVIGWYSSLGCIDVFCDKQKIGELRTMREVAQGVVHSIKLGAFHRISLNMGWCKRQLCDYYLKCTGLKLTQRSVR